MGSLPKRQGPTGASNQRPLPPLWREGDDAPSTRRTAEHQAKTGKRRAAGPYGSCHLEVS